MSYLLPHLRTGWAVDQAILNEEDRVVVVRFGHDYDPVCMQMDEALSKIADKVKNFCVVYLVDITEVPDFNTMYELYDPCTVMTFFRNKHIMIDLGTGNNNKINWALTNTQELIDLIETGSPGRAKGPRARGVAEGLRHEVPVLSSVRCYLHAHGALRLGRHIDGRRDTLSLYVASTASRLSCEWSPCIPMYCNTFRRPRRGCPGRRRLGTSHW